MWDWFESVWRRGLDWWRSTIDGAVGAVRDYIAGAVQDISRFFQQLGSELSAALAHLFGPIWNFLSDTWYLIERVIGLVGLLLRIVLEVLQIPVSLGAGIINTLASVALFDPVTVTPAPKSLYANGVDWVLGLIGPWISPLAGILEVGVWLAVGFTVFRILAPAASDG